MADIPNMPGGSVPPKPSDSKVLPKKETVRITLPPKPSAAPTIKLPTLPPGGPSAAPGGPASSAPRAAAPATSAPRAAGAPTSAAASAQRPAQRPAPAPRPSAAATVSGFDKMLAITAGVMALAALATTLLIVYMWMPQIPVQ